MDEERRPVERAHCKRCGGTVELEPGQQILSCDPIITPYRKADQKTDILGYAHGVGRFPLPGIWQPIDTAPRNGTHVLAHGPMRDAWSASGVLVAVYEEGHWRTYPSALLTHPTHWMPLPEPPAGRSSAPPAPPAPPAPSEAPEKETIKP